MRLVQFESMESCLGRSMKDQPIHFYNTQGPSPAAYLEANVEAPILDMALGQMNHAEATWRAMVNFRVATGSLHIQFCPGSRAALRDPAWLAASWGNAEDEFVTLRFAISEEPSMGGLVTETDLKDAETLLKELEDEASPKSTAKLTLDAIRMFSLALDQSMWHHALFLLWQTAEVMTLPINSRGNHDELCKRLALLGNLTDQQACRHYELALRDIKQLRNDIAHAGASGAVQDMDVRLLIAKCQEAIWWLIQNRNRFPAADDLWAYFRAASVSHQEFERMRHVHSQIAGLRGDDTK